MTAYIDPETGKLRSNPFGIRPSIDPDIVKRIADTLPDDRYPSPDAFTATTSFPDPSYSTPAGLHLADGQAGAESDPSWSLLDHPAAPLPHNPWSAQLGSIGSPSSPAFLGRSSAPTSMPEAFCNVPPGGPGKAALDDDIRQAMA